MSEMPHKEDLDKEFLLRELRVGIALEPGRRTVKEGMFYMPEMLRLDDNPQHGRAGFILEVMNLEQLEKLYFAGRAFTARGRGPGGAL
jgi:CRISPR/Cas system CMR-associated protein Cmr3 (group 5 of RAMP superfamily)